MTEADYCAKLRVWAELQGFTVYPEVDGWDIVLTTPSRATLWRRIDVDVGEQVGIHAKMRANCDVLVQAMPGKYRGPTWPLVAVPVAGLGFRTIANRLGIGIIEGVAGPRISIFPSRSKVDQLLTLPSIASRAIVAGAPSPRTLSPWRDKALRFLIWARANDGKITVADLARFGLSKHWARIWLQATGAWLQIEIGGEPREPRPRRLMTYRLTTDETQLPDHGYADVLAELAGVALRG